MCRRRLLALVLVGSLSVAGRVATQAAQGTWLDRPLTSWNDAAAAYIPRPPQPVTRTDIQRCRIEVTQSSPASRAVAEAGWIAFRPFERTLTSGDIEVVGGMRSATEDCGPAHFNLFVFVSGAYAGTLSPMEMTTAKDGVVGTVRFPPGDVITAEFARYGVTDTECCPSGRVRVSYRIERRATGAIVVATETRRLR